MRSGLFLVVAVYVGVALGQNDILKAKWGLVFDYYNLVKQTDGTAEVLNNADYQAMKNKLDNSDFQSVAKDVADVSYPPPMADPQGSASITRDGLIDVIGEDWKAGKLNDTAMTDLMYHFITTVKGVPLTRQACVDFEVAVGVMNEAEAGAAFDKMMVLVGNSGAQIVTKAEYGVGYAKYFDDGTVTASDLPLFAQPT